MIVQVNTAKGVESSQRLHDFIDEKMKESLSRFSDRITRIEVHLSDQNSEKKGGADDMQCRIEARLEGLQPVIATSREATLDRAIVSAIDKIKASLTTIVGKLQKR